MKDASNYENARKVLNDIIVKLFRKILMIEERSMKNRGVHDLSITEIHTIEAIGTRSFRTMSEIAEKLDITMGTLTASVNRLEKKGYVRRERDTSDRRIVLASLTERGEFVEEVHKSFHQDMIDHILNDLKLGENQVLIRTLRNINEFFLREYGRSNGG